MQNTRVHEAIRALVFCLLLSAWLPDCNAVEGAPSEPQPDRTPAASCAGCTTLTGGTVFDGSRYGRGVVVIEGDKIRNVAFGDAQIAEGKVIDVSGKTVLPGLIDLHIHAQADAGPYNHFETKSHVDDYLKVMLRSGVTSSLDLGASKHMIFSYRERARKGTILAPHLFASGPLLTTTGGHPCYGSLPGDFCVFIDSPADADAALHKLAPDGPDLVKIVIDGGVDEPIPSMSGASAAAVEAAAEKNGLRVIAHVSSTADLETALDAGVTLFSHLPIKDRISPALAAKMAQKGVMVVPTLSFADGLYRIAHGTLTEIDAPGIDKDVPQSILASLHDPYELGDMTSAYYKTKTTTWRDNALANLATCYEAGVSMAGGSDAGNPGVFHGLSMARELALYVEAGMKPLDALITATRAAADLLQRPELGRLEAGATADVLVVEGDPLTDMRALGRVSRVYRAGALLDREALAVHP